ncbi:MAG TPA: VTT domain-containing protein [Acidobacteriota bacterium]|nr:VTT domain-containing protein [Acidobacteriota bacterium]
MRFLERLSKYLIGIGLPGLFTISLLDSAAVPMVGGPDVVIMLLSWRSPAQLPAIVLAASIGSMLGCIILYRIAKAGGRIALDRLSPERRARVVSMVERNATWAVFTSVVMPPPFPTKAVILAAGAFHAPLGSFTVAVLIGRLVRYSAIAWLGARFGDQAAQVIKAHYIAILGVLLGAVLVFLVSRRTRRKGSRG